MAQYCPIISFKFEGSIRNMPFNNTSINKIEIIYLTSISYFLRKNLAF